MGYDFPTARSLVEELQEALEGRRIHSAVSSAHGLDLACGDRHLRIRIGRRPALFLGTRDRACPSGVASDPALPYLVGARLDRVSLAQRDRLVCLRLERVSSRGSRSYGLLRVELVPHHGVAVLTRERDREILGLWGERGRSQPRLQVGSTYIPLTGFRRLIPHEDSFTAFAAAVGADPRPLAQVMARSVSMMDRHCAEEVLMGVGYTRTVRASELSAEALRQVWERCGQLYLAAAPKECAVWKEGDRWMFSVLRPHSAKDPVEIFESVSRATEYCLSRQRETDAFRQRVGRTQQRLRAVQAALLRRERALREDLEAAAGAEDEEHVGHTLLAHIGRIPVRGGRVTLPDVYAEEADESTGGIGENLDIVLDPTRSGAENAARHLKRARKLYRRRQVLPERLAACRCELERVRSLLEALEQGGEDALGRSLEWLMEHGFPRGAGRAAGSQGRKTDEVHPRRYRTRSGWSVWVGRNSRENDVITHRKAAQNDFWFHARGYAGAHVILRREGRREEPGTATLEEAAQVAAYWSKGRTARRVPVVYTMVKYVTRPRGGAPGQAAVRREKVLMVEPKLLPEEDQAGPCAPIAGPGSC